MTKEKADPFLSDMRRSIDNLDNSFIRLLSERMRVVEKIIYLKKKLNLDLTPGEERKDDLKHLMQISEQLDLNVEFFQKILDQVFQGAIEQFQQKEDDWVLDQICKDLSIDELRINLLNLEKSICHILTERFRVVKRIGKHKKQHHINPLDPKRWDQVLEEKIEIASTLNLNKMMIETIFNTIHEAALSIENIME